MYRIGCPMLDENPNNIEALVLKAQKGSTEAFDEIMNQTWDSAVSTVIKQFGRTLGYFDPEDLAEMAFITAWEKLPELKEAKAYRGWFSRILRRKCINALRIARASTLIGMPEAEFDRMILPPRLYDEIEFSLSESGPYQHLVRKELVEESLTSLRNIYTKLTEIQQRVFVARVINLLDEAETRKCTNLPIGTVRSATRTIQDQLSREFRSSRQQVPRNQDRILAFIEAAAGWQLGRSDQAI
jgi:RNA polymerase sigma-70 factor, ECF subfamily